MTTNYTVYFLDRPYGKEWVEQSIEDFDTETGARKRFNDSVVASLVSSEPIKIVMKKGKIKVADFSLSYGV